MSGEEELDDYGNLNVGTIMPQGKVIIMPVVVCEDANNLLKKTEAAELVGAWQLTFPATERKAAIQATRTWRTNDDKEPGYDTGRKPSDLWSNVCRCHGLKSCPFSFIKIRPHNTHSHSTTTYNYWPGTSS